MPRIRAVAFDLFGTLVHIGRPRHPYAQLLLALGLDPQQAKTHRRWIMANDMGLAGVANGLGSGEPLSLAKLAHIERELFAELASVRPYPETLNVLRQLQNEGIKIAIASNLAAPYAIPVQALLPTLDAYAWSFKLGTVKPEAEFFNAVAEALDVPHDQILMVGDNTKNDVAGARAAGMQAVHINRAPERTADTVRGDDEIGTLLDLFDVLGLSAG